MNRRMFYMIPLPQRPDHPNRPWDWDPEDDDDDEDD
jgi:hypothetical protein